MSLQLIMTKESHISAFQPLWKTISHTVAGLFISRSIVSKATKTSLTPPPPPPKPRYAHIFSPFPAHLMLFHPVAAPSPFRLIPDMKHRFRRHEAQFFRLSLSMVQSLRLAHRWFCLPVGKQKSLQLREQARQCRPTAAPARLHSRQRHRWLFG